MINIQRFRFFVFDADFVNKQELEISILKKPRSFTQYRIYRATVEMELLLLSSGPAIPLIYQVDSVV